VLAHLRRRSLPLLFLSVQVVYLLWLITILTMASILTVWHP
jgi:hypothetical protein